MRQIVIFVLIALLHPKAATAQDFAHRLDSLAADSMFATSQLGMMVYDLTADSTIYKKGERQLLRPASTMKLLTAITAIDRLGGSYLFDTSLYYTGKIDNKTLDGNIYCVGGFDPRFNADDMRAFVEGIRQLGVDTIRGAIVADKTMKDSTRLGAGWCWDDDNPMLSPLLVSRNDNFAEKFMEELKDNGIVVNALTMEGALPREAVFVCRRSHSIEQILVTMMKDSDNLYAEAMFYQLAALGGRRATAEDAQGVIRRLIDKVGVSGDYRIADGSGLSLYNYVTAELLVGLLRYAYRNGNVYEQLYPSLPIAGRDGTLKKRMRKTAADGNVYAKTGTLTGVISLAGYLTAANGHLLAFAIINQGVMTARSARNFQDRVCIELCKSEECGVRSEK